LLYLIDSILMELVETRYTLHNVILGYFNALNHHFRG